MTPKITDYAIDHAFNMAFDDVPIQKKAKELFLVKDALCYVAGKYFWLPVYEMFKEAELITANLELGDFMMRNSMAIKGYRCFDDEESKVTYFLTEDGFNFLDYVIYCMMEYEEGEIPDFGYLTDGRLQDNSWVRNVLSSESNS